MSDFVGWCPWCGPLTIGETYPGGFTKQPYCKECELMVSGNGADDALALLEERDAWKARAEKAERVILGLVDNIPNTREGREADHKLHCLANEIKSRRK
jgi:hypothetical protein